MRRTVFAVFALVALPALTGSASADSQSFDRIERGRYLARLGDCVACHTAPGGKPFAGGLALETPFGKIVSSNITPDPQTGIGAWTDDEFIAAMHEGRGRGGKRLYPAMPYTAYTKVSRDDVLAIRTYLNTLEPVSNPVVSNQLPFPFNIRFNLLFWNYLNFTPGPFRPTAGKSDEWNRGAYLVEGLAHCGTCHTPKNILGGDKSGSALQGGALQGWFAPNITADKHKGIGEWGVPDIVQYLKTGVTDWTLASGPMADMVTHSSSHIDDGDLKAIAVYLKDIGADKEAPKPVPVAATDPVMVAGQTLYKDNCAACHTESGGGAARLFPGLNGNSLVQSDDPTTLIRLLLEGSRAVSTAGAPTGPAMPTFGWQLNDEQAGAVLTYIRNAWGNAAAPVTADVVKTQRGAAR